MHTDIIIASIWIFLWELYGNMVWWWSLVTQVVLQNILHFDLRQAMALDNAAVIGSNIWMLLILWRKYKIKWWYFLFIVFQSIWAWFWALILIKIDLNLLKIIFISSIILLVLKNLFIKDKEHHEKWFRETPLNIFFLSITAIFIWGYNSAFVIWDWIISLLLLTSVFKIEYKNAIFLLVFSMIFSQPIALYNYYSSWLLDLKFLIPMIFATLISWLIAWTLLSKIHSKVLEKILKYLSVGLVIYLIWWIF